MSSELMFKTDTSLYKTFTNAVILCLFLVILCIFFCHLDETVTAEGQIRPQISENNVVALYSGIINDVFYTNSQYVHEGDVLFTQDCIYEEMYLINLIELKSIYDKHVRFYKEVQSLLDNTTISFCDYDNNIQETNTFYSVFINKYEKYRNEIDIKERYYERLKSCFPVTVSKQELEDAENDLFQTKKEFAIWIENERIDTTEKLAELYQALEVCSLNIFKTKKTIESASVKAKQSGFVNEKMKISKGDYVKEGSEIITIIPEDESLKAVINVSNANISKIKIGQEVLFQIEDLSYSKYGKLHGYISLIPRDVLSSSIYYPIEVNLSNSFLESKNMIGKKQRVDLKVGTKVTSKVIVDSNTIFQKLLQKMVIYDN